MHIPKTIDNTGSAAQVFHGTKMYTSGGLMRNDLMQTKDGRIVSKKKHLLGKKMYTKLMKNPQFKAQWNAQKKK
jgi:hypothetical protein